VKKQKIPNTQQVGNIVVSKNGSFLYFFGFLMKKNSFMTFFSSDYLESVQLEGILSDGLYFCFLIIFI
jgi:hypothetical protein